MTLKSAYAIVPFEPQHQARFAELNRAWLLEYNLLEAPDLAQLEDPQRYFIEPNGQVYVALRNGEVVGTVAVVPTDAMSSWEIAKLAVDPAERGQGLGRLLVEQCIAFVRQHGATKVVLVSNHQLVAAIRMYESFGFAHRPLPETGYATADVYMELLLDG